MADAYRIGNGDSAPQVLWKCDPEYSAEALEAKLEGLVGLSVVVDEHGFLRDIKVVKSLGLGLDEKAIEAAMRWRFGPALKDGFPIPVEAHVEFNLRLPSLSAPPLTTGTLVANPDTPCS